MLRFPLTGFEGSDFAFGVAHRFLCDAAILLRAAGLTVRLPVWRGDAAGIPSAEPSWRRMSAIFSSTFRFICWNPIKAASRKDVSPVLCPAGISVRVLLVAIAWSIRVTEPIMTQLGLCRRWLC